MAEAIQINNKFKALPAGAKINEFCERIKVEHRDFMQSFWVVVQAIAFLGRFNQRVLKKYFIKCAAAGDISKLDDKFEIDGDYLMWLEMAYNKHYKRADMQLYRSQMIANMREERDKMKQLQENAAKEWEEEQERQRAERLAAKKAALLKMALAAKAGVTQL